MQFIHGRRGANDVCGLAPTVLRGGAPAHRRVHDRPPEARVDAHRAELRADDLKHLGDEAELVDVVAGLATVGVLKLRAPRAGEFLEAEVRAEGHPSSEMHSRQR